MEFINVVKKQISNEYQDVFCNNSKNTCINQFLLSKNNEKVVYTIEKINDAEHLQKSDINLKKEYGPK